MEAVFFILVGGALFSQSWNLLGLLAEGSTRRRFSTDVFDSPHN